MPSITPEIIAALAKNDDFGFEMRVGRELRDHLEKVRHGETYVDHRTGTQRQFDYQCAFTNDWRRLQLAIECKNLFIDAPAVVCGHARVSAESIHDVVCASHGILRSRDGNTAYDGEVSEVARVGPESALYPFLDPAGCFVGKSVFRPKPPKDKRNLEKFPNQGFTIMSDDEDYDRWNQALGSAADMVLSSLDFRNVRAQTSAMLSVTLPIIAVPNGTLWQLEFDEDGELASNPRPTDHVTLFRDHRVNNAKIGNAHFRRIRLSHIHFLTLTGLGVLLKILKSRESIFWATTFPEPIAKDFAERLQYSS